MLEYLEDVNIGPIGFFLVLMFLGPICVLVFREQDYVNRKNRRVGLR